MDSFEFVQEVYNAPLNRKTRSLFIGKDLGWLTLNHFNLKIANEVIESDGLVHRQPTLKI